MPVSAIEEVGADAVMVGRTAMGNRPYLQPNQPLSLETGEVLPDSPLKLSGPDPDKIS